VNNIMSLSGEIRDTFYNLLLDAAINVGETEIEFRDALMGDCEYRTRSAVRRLLEKVLLGLARMDVFSTCRGTAITADNVPDEYANLLNSLNRLKRAMATRDQSRLQSYFLIRFGILPMGLNYQRRCLSKIVSQIEALETFRSIIVDFVRFYRELFQKSSIKNETTETAETAGIDESMIRQTFYNLMVERVLLDGLIDKNDLATREAYIFIGMSSLAIVECLIASRNLDEGMLLLNGKVVTDYNCPERYRDFFAALKPLKIGFRSLSREQVDLIRTFATMNPSADMPEHLKTEQLMRLVAQITDVSIKISQLANFKSIIDSVIRFCIEAKGEFRHT